MLGNDPGRGIENAGTRQWPESTPVGKRDNVRIRELVRGANPWEAWVSGLQQEFLILSKERSTPKLLAKCAVTFSVILSLVYIDTLASKPFFLTNHPYAITVSQQTL